MMLIGYIRVSKSDGSQVLDLQRDALAEAGVEASRIYEDLASGRQDDRPGLTTCLKALQPGNTLVVWKLDRLGRDLKHLVGLVDMLNQRQVGLKVLASAGAQMDTTTANCNGLQWKWLRTAINGNLGPDYLHLSIPSGRDYLQLRLLLSSWDCNQRRQDHIKCDYSEPPASACLDVRGSTCISQERLGGAPVSYISRPGAKSVSSHLKPPY